jgi:hypothetical protein
MNYYQGETIRFDVEAGEGFDPDSIDFTARVCTEGTTPVVIARSQMERLAQGAYRATIPATATAAMGIGKYHIELMLKQYDGVRCIARDEAFTLVWSASKQELL